MDACRLQIAIELEGGDISHCFIAKRGEVFQAKVDTDVLKGQCILDADVEIPLAACILADDPGTERILAQTLTIHGAKKRVTDLRGRGKWQESASNKVENLIYTIN
jgi:hypothetical protein